jgi:hypothetical protein
MILRIRALCLCLALGAGAAQGASAQIETLLENGDPAPGTGQAFTGFGRVAINDAGTVAFHGFVVGPGNSGLWRLSGGTLERLAATGQVPPGAPSGQTLDWIDGILLPQTGDTVVFRTEFLGSEEAYYAVGSGGLAPIAIEGQPAPGTDGVFQWIHPSLRVSDAGEVAFWATIEGGTVSPGFDGTGIWSGSAGNLALVARQGDPAPGGNGDTWFIVDQYPRISPGGLLAFAAVLFGANGHAGVWTGAPLPGLPPVFSAFSDYRSAFVSESEELLFTEFHSQSGGPVELRAGLPGDLRTVISDGDVAPGLPGVPIHASWPWLEPRMNRPGQVAFRTETQEAVPREGLWSEGSGSLQLLALEGLPVPGEPGLSYDQIQGFQINDLGQTAFVADLHGLSGRGLFLTGPGETPQLVARGDGWLEVAPGDLRQVSGVSVSLESEQFSWETERGALNNAGELVFSLSFYDGTSGVFVATLPEPSKNATMLSALLTLAWLARRRARIPATPASPGPPE